MEGLIDTRNEYIAHIQDILGIAISKRIYSIWADSIKDNKGIKGFQNELYEIKKWNNNIVNDEYKKIVKYTKCKYLLNLIKVIIITTIKIKIYEYRNQFDNIKIKIPNPEDFVHKCFMNVSSFSWKNAYLFNKKNVKDAEYQNNLNIIEENIRIIIKKTFRDFIPFDEIFNQIEENLSGDIKQFKEYDDVISSSDKNKKLSKKKSENKEKIIEIQEMKEDNDEDDEDDEDEEDDEDDEDEDDEEDEEEDDEEDEDEEDKNNEENEEDDEENEEDDEENEEHDEEDNEEHDEEDNEDKYNEVKEKEIKKDDLKEDILEKDDIVEENKIKEHYENKVNETENINEKKLSYNIDNNIFNGSNHENKKELCEDTNTYEEVKKNNEVFSQEKESKYENEVFTQDNKNENIEIEDILLQQKYENTEEIKLFDENKYFKELQEVQKDEIPIIPEKTSYDIDDDKSVSSDTSYVKKIHIKENTSTRSNKKLSFF
jgi:hypothetical protein